MGCLEEEFLNSCELKPRVWWRFLDDVFMIWLLSEEELNKFLTRLNSFHKTIKFTWEFSLEEIFFLDVRVVRINGAFETDVYSKPTDAHQYLNFKSCYPPHIKKGIPYSQALRFKRICSNETQLREKLDDLEGFLVKRGYFTVIFMVLF